MEDSSDSSSSKFDKDINDLICPECHIAILYPRNIEGQKEYHKCPLCGYTRVRAVLIRDYTTVNGKDTKTRS